MNRYPRMFSPMTIRGVTFKNRVMASPMTTARTVDDRGCPTQECIDGYETRARGGVAAVTVTETFVDFDRGARHDHSIDFISPDLTVRHLESLFTLAESIKAHGAVASVQFNHIGNVNHPSTIPSGRNPIGPTGFVREDGVVVEEMTEEDMYEIADAFAHACEGAALAGFEMVMIHGAHGWLLGQFVSPLTNRRKDKYGGSMENRARFPIMVLDRIRRKCPELLIEYRLSGSERVPGGLEVEECAEFARLIQDRVDLIHVTSGLYHNHVASKAFSSMFHPHGCNLDLAEAIKKAVNIPVVAVGGFNHPRQIEDAIASRKCDFVALGRQMLADPQFVNKVAEGREDEIAPCLRCSCFNPLPPDADRRPQAEPFQCTVNPYSMRELRMQWAPPVKKKRNVLVVGGGPGGLYAAITAAERGHNVTLLEKENRLGGLLWFTEVDCHKEDLRRYRDSLITRVHMAGVNVVTGITATADTIREYNPDAVIIAIGSEPAVPPIPGIREYAHHAMYAYSDPDKIGKKVVMIGGGLIGVECSMHLAEAQGCEVQIVEMLDDYARDAYMSHREAIDLFMPDTVHIKCGVRCTEVKPNSVTVLEKDGTEIVYEADTILYAVGMKAKTAELYELLKAHPNTRFIGDCKKPARILQAVRDGMFAAYDII
ncbi:MAG TPA: FAD-dependent oxidoreductase [Clostridiales bacterium]|nr:FAD-dependent oxidoreductase [Clostridiales bacterium]